MKRSARSIRTILSVYLLMFRVMEDYVNVLPRSFFIIVGYAASNLLENFHSRKVPFFFPSSILMYI